MIETRLKDLREDHDFSQNYVADYLHIAQPTYSDYETGRLNTPIEVYIKLADLYETSTDYIVKRTNCAQPYHSPYWVI